MDQPTLLTVIPTFNEAQNIRQLIDRLCELYPTMTILIVDDASPDGTGQKVKDAQAVHGSRVQLLERQGKGGRGSAVLEGFKLAMQQNVDLIFEMDSDFSHEPTEIQRFLDAIPHYDMVLGSRYLPSSRIEEWGIKRTIFSRFANQYARLVLGIPITDYTNGFRCYTRKAIDALEMDRIDSKGYVVLSEVAYQLHLKGMKIGEVPTVFINRRRGISNLGWHEIREAFMSVLRIRWQYEEKKKSMQQTAV
ncbi:MAG: polyprenol monophosphomannose synthase [Candidatus Peribacteraceae bacterium]|nr:polyprenol monophosphomannose synthase [Candidatus Peribacteraceae bacterium]